MGPGGKGPPQPLPRASPRGCLNAKGRCRGMLDVRAARQTEGHYSQAQQQGARQRFSPGRALKPALLPPLLPQKP